MEQLINYVVIDGQQYMISTTDTFDAGLETMVFESRDFKITNWFDLYARHYSTWQEAIDGHQDIIENLEKYLTEERKDWSWLNGEEVGDN